VIRLLVYYELRVESKVHGQKGNSAGRQVQKGNCLFGHGNCLFDVMEISLFEKSCLSVSTSAVRDLLALKRTDWYEISEKNDDSCRSGGRFI
jgi:hypothetical protein